MESSALPIKVRITEMLLAFAESNRYWVRLRPPKYSVDDGVSLPAAASSVNHLQQQTVSRTALHALQVAARGIETDVQWTLGQGNCDSRIASHEEKLLQR